MKKLLFLLFLALLSACQNKSKQEKSPVEDTIFETTFQNYKEVDHLKDYEKISDTSIHVQVLQDEVYRLMKLRNEDEHLVLFYKVDDNDSKKATGKIYRAIDTLHVKQLQVDERLTIGYCYHESYSEGEVVAVIKQTDSIRIREIVRAWRANPESGSFEVLENHEDINCLNEYFESENSTIPIEKMT